MDYLKTIDLGASILSLSILLGFFALITLVLRTLLIGINYGLERLRKNGNKSNIDNKGLHKNGF